MTTFSRASKCNHVSQVQLDTKQHRYNCVICHDAIDVHIEMWSCKDCHHIYHFKCAERWGIRCRDEIPDDSDEEEPSALRNFWSWPCPTCKRPQDGGSLMLPCYWCGNHAKTTFKLLVIHVVRNALNISFAKAQERNARRNVRRYVILVPVSLSFARRLVR